MTAFMTISKHPPHNHKAMNSTLAPLLPYQLSHLKYLNAKPTRMIAMLLAGRAAVHFLIKRIPSRLHRITPVSLS